MLALCVMASPQSVTPQDLDKLRQEILQRQQRETWINFAETLAWIAGFMGSIWLIKQRGVEAARAAWKFAKLCATGPMLLQKVIDGQEIIQGSLVMLGARLRTLEDFSDIACFVTEPDGRWIGVSETLSELIGAYPPKVHNHGWKIRIESVDRERVFGDWTSAVKHGEPFAADFYCVHEDGKRVKVSLSAVPQFGASGMKIGYVGTMRKISGSGEIKPLPHQ